MQKESYSVPVNRTVGSVDAEHYSSRAAKKQADPSKTITVQGSQPGHVAMWERHPGHEAAGHAGGEVFITDQPMKVARTHMVMERIELGVLDVVED